MTVKKRRLFATTSLEVDAVNARPTGPAAASEEFPQRNSSQLFLAGSQFNITFRIGGRLSMAQRRAILYALAHEIVPHFRQLSSATLTHCDANAFHPIQAHWRTPALRLAHQIKSAQGKMGLSIRLRRLALGLTLKEVSAMAGLSLWHLSRLERGHYYPRSESLEKLEVILQTPLPRLPRDLKWVSPQNPNTPSLEDELDKE